MRNIHLVLFFATLTLLVACSSHRIPVVDYSRVHIKTDDDFKEFDSSVDYNLYVPKDNFPLATDNISKIDNSTVTINNIRREPVRNIMPDNSKPNIVTKYEIINGYPIWYNNTDIIGYKYTAIGSSLPDYDGFSVQKKKATMNAYAELARVVNISIETELNISSVNRNAITYKADMLQYSRQKSSDIIAKQRMIDEWINPKTGEYIVILGVEEEK